MTDPHDQHDQTVILDLENDAVVADTDSIQVFRAGELLDAPFEAQGRLGSRLLGQPVHGADEADLIVLRELEKLSPRGWA